VAILGEMIRTAKLSQNQRTRWRKKGIIPVQILTTILDWGIKFQIEAPETGMSLPRFLELLWRFYLLSDDEVIRNSALHLYEDTVKSEQMPKWQDKVRPRKIKLNWDLSKNGR